MGWPELAETVAEIDRGLPQAEKASAGILAGNYGEAGALRLYGPELGLAQVFSGGDSFWLQGYPEPPPAP